jgi:uncharacterized protein YaeQ
MIEKFTFDIEFKKFRKKMILVKGDCELRDHVVLKVLAYILYYDPKLQIEVDVGWHYKPDLVMTGDRGEPLIWIDCGYVSLLKAQNIIRKMRNGRLIFLKSNENELRQFKSLLDKKVDDLMKTEFLAFEPGFVSNVAAALGRTNQITLYPISETAFGLALNDQVFESNIIH